jgi:hypothetical protein
MLVTLLQKASCSLLFVHRFLDETGTTVILYCMTFPYLTSLFYDIQGGNKEDETWQYYYNTTIQEQAEAVFETVHVCEYFEHVQLIVRGSK